MNEKVLISDGKPITFRGELVMIQPSIVDGLIQVYTKFGGVIISRSYLPKYIAWLKIFMREPKERKFDN